MSSSNPPQSPPQEAGVRDIIIAFGSSMVSALNGVPRPDDVTLDDVMATISAAVDGIIGQDEEVPEDIWHNPYPQTYRDRNQLRAEMQRRRKELGL